MSAATTTASLKNDRDWKRHAVWCDDGYFRLQTDDIGDVPVRLFLTPALLTELEPTLYPQIVHASRFAGCRLVVITPDAHFGYGVPVGCALLTDREAGAVAMGPVGFDIGCGMMSAKSGVPASMATPDRMRQFNAAVLARVDMGVGGGSKALGHVERLIRSFFAAFPRAIPLPRSNCARLIDVRIIMAHHKHQQTPYPHQV